MRRRTFLATVGAASGGLAGCLSPESPIVEEPERPHRASIRIENEHTEATDVSVDLFDDEGNPQETVTISGFPPGGLSESEFRDYAPGVYTFEISAPGGPYRPEWDTTECPVLSLTITVEDAETTTIAEECSEASS